MFMDQATLTKLDREIDSALASLDRAELANVGESLPGEREAARKTYEQGRVLASTAEDEDQRASIEAKLFLLSERLKGVDPGPVPPIRPPDDDE